MDELRRKQSIQTHLPVGTHLVGFPSRAMAETWCVSLVCVSLCRRLWRILPSSKVHSAVRRTGTSDRAV